MSTAVSKSALFGVTLALLCPLSDPVTAAKPDNWSDIPVHTVGLFYPGQSRYQWLRGKEHKKAYQKTRRGEFGLSCHEEEEADIGDLIITGERLEPYPIGGWVKDDVLPQYQVSRANAKGSAADNQDVTGVWKDGTWTVVWVGKLNSGNADDKLLQVGGVVTLGFAVHDDNVDSRPLCLLPGIPWIKYRGGYYSDHSESTYSCWAGRA